MTASGAVSGSSGFAPLAGVLEQGTPFLALAPGERFRCVSLPHSGSAASRPRGNAGRCLFFVFVLVSAMWRLFCAPVVVRFVPFLFLFRFIN